MPQLHPLSLLSQRGRARPWLLTALVVLVLTGAGWWWKTRQATNAPAAATQGGSGPGAAARRFGGGQTTQPVSVGTVQRQDIRVLVSAIGTVTARNTATVRAKVDGELQAIRFKEGDMVRAGQLLAEIDPRSYQATLDQAQGTLARDQALLRNAELDLQRYRDLLAKDSIARQQVDTQEALVRQNQGTVQSDQAQVNSAKLQLSYTRITAPIAGRLGLRQADLGNVVHASDTNGIVTITQVQPINAVFSIPEASLPQVTARLHTGAELPVQLCD
ncbi:MAG TPA: efflux RND transporter periplasmic adaptor subunit, partial [Burkholderiaceae bacterium]